MIAYIRHLITYSGPFIKSLTFCFWSWKYEIFFYNLFDNPKLNAEYFRIHHLLLLQYYNVYSVFYRWGRLAKYKSGIADAKCSHRVFKLN